MLVSGVLDALQEALRSQQSDMEETEVKPLAILSLNWGAFAKSIDSLQRILLYVMMNS